jgi:non-specific serine/threonine protein kinase
MVGRPEQSVILTEESIGLHRELGNATALAYALYGQSFAVADLGDSVRAKLLTEEGLRISREIGNKRGMAMAFKDLARFALFDRDVDGATELLHTAFGFFQPMGDRWLISIAFDILAGVKTLQGAATASVERGGPARPGGPGEHLLDAVRFYAWSDLLREQQGLEPPPEMHGTPAQNVALLHELLGEPAFSQAWAEGRAMSSQQAVEYALAITASAGPACAATTDGVTAASGASVQSPVDPELARLTARERDVVGLVARGRTNRQIAEALVLSERTVDTHVHNILGKLELTARAQIAAWAVEHGVGRAR